MQLALFYICEFVRTRKSVKIVLLQKTVDLIEYIQVLLFIPATLVVAK